jgi:transposase
LRDDAGMKLPQETLMNLIGIDLGKTVFHLVSMSPQGTIIGRKKLSRPQMLTYLANVSRSLVAMEASCGAHHLGRRLEPWS